MNVQSGEISAKKVIRVLSIPRVEFKARMRAICEVFTVSTKILTTGRAICHHVAHLPLCEKAKKAHTDSRVSQSTI